MSFKLKLLATVLTVFAFAQLSQAVTITLEGVDYKVTTVETHDLDTILTETPWWTGVGGDMSLADSAALQVGSSLGLPNLTGWGPFFSTAHGYNSAYTSSGSIINFGGWTNPSDVHVWAIATKVSVPDSGTSMVLLASGMLLLTVLRRKYS